MPTGPTLLLFSAAALALLLFPGPAVLYIVNRSIAQGPRAGLVSVAGIHVGTTLHVAAGVLGLSALLVASSTAFTIVKVAGAMYLIFLGVQAWGTPGDSELVTGGSTRSLRRVFVDGVVVNALNPKTAVFFLAFVPQFVDHTRSDTTLQLVTLGGLFIALGIVSDGAYAFAAGAIADWLRHHPGSGRLRARGSGAVLVGLGVAALFGRVE
jgi:threonine/homoserine/homoserine lactone efflux protein